MTTQFKAGDVVRCIDREAHGANNVIPPEVGTVEKVEGFAFLHLQGVAGMWSTGRFVLAEPVVWASEAREQFEWREVDRNETHILYEANCGDVVQAVRMVGMRMLDAPSTMSHVWRAELGQRGYKYSDSGDIGNATPSEDYVPRGAAPTPGATARKVPRAWPVPLGPAVCAVCSTPCQVTGSDCLFSAEDGKDYPLCNGCWLGDIGSEEWESATNKAILRHAELDDKAISALMARRDAKVKALGGMLRAPAQPRFPPEGRSDRVLKINSSLRTTTSTDESPNG